MNSWIEQLPPWKAFPNMSPSDAGARQGAQELWVDQVWRPFWSSLTPSQRDSYLLHWQATEAWRHAIRSTFETPTDLDLEADAAESEEWLSTRAAAALEPTWRDRLKRIWGKNRT